MTTLRILQNQEGFSTDEYRRCATPLVDALDRKPIPQWLKGLRHNGFVAGLLMYLCADGYDAVVTVSHRPAMVYGLLNRLIPRKRPIHVAKEFFFEDEAGGARSLKSRVLSGLYRFSLKHVQAVIVNATGEIAPYSRFLRLPESRFRFIPWPSNIGEPKRIDGHDGTVLAVGRSLRDWKTFFQSVEGLDLRCVVIASRQDVQGLRVPTNVDIFLDVPHVAYLQFLQRAMTVVIPLRETKRSTGQACFLEAMAYGKSVVVADVIGARDYISNGDNGLTYRPGDAADLREKISALATDHALRERLAGRGLQSVVTRFNKTVYAQAMIAAVSEVLASCRTAGAGEEGRI